MFTKLHEYFLVILDVLQITKVFRKKGTGQGGSGASCHRWNARLSLLRPQIHRQGFVRNIQAIPRGGLVRAVWPDEGRSNALGNPVITFSGECHCRTRPDRSNAEL